MNNIIKKMKELSNIPDDVYKVKITIKNIDLSILKDLSIEYLELIHVPEYPMNYYWLSIKFSSKVTFELRTNDYNINQYYTLKGQYEED